MGLNGNIDVKLFMCSITGVGDLLTSISRVCCIVAHRQKTFAFLLQNLLTVKQIRFAVLF